MGMSFMIKIDERSRIPKYQQVADSIVKSIAWGSLTVGEKIPSINEVSETCYLSRDTVEKAYQRLKAKKIIVSVKGKGYYVARKELATTTLLFLINKLSSYKMRIYNAFVQAMGGNIHIDLHIYHCDQNIFLNLLEEHQGGYDYYVIMPHFKDDDLRHINETAAITAALRRIPTGKLLLLDNILPSIDRDFAAVYQDFEADINEALTEGLSKLRKYDKLLLAYPQRSIYPYPREIVRGFKKFCATYSFHFEILNEIDEDTELRSRDAYVVVEENDLVNLVKQTRDQGLMMGSDIGIVSYNDTPLKALLDITVVSTDFQVMGETAAYMILKKKQEQVKNAFRLIDRNSL